MKKLSGPMIEMIKGATMHEVRVDGEIVRCGYVVAGRSGTIVALMDRDLITACDASNHGMHWLTPAGIKVLSDLVGPVDMPALGDDVTPEDHPTESDMITGDARDARINAREAAIEADNARLAASWDEGETAAQWADVEAGEAFDARGDAERTWDAENAAAERADIDAENAREIAAEREESMEEWHDTHSVPDSAAPQCYCANDSESCLNCNGHEHIIDEIITDDRVMVLTTRGVFVSMNYLNTMRRIGRETAAARQRSREVTEIVARAMTTDAWLRIDEEVRSGTRTFRDADKAKRIVQQLTRPAPKVKRPKRKPSKNR